MGGGLGQRSAADGRKQRLACWGREEQKKKGKRKKKRGIRQLEWACQRGRRRDGASLRNSGMTILDVFAS